MFKPSQLINVGAHIGSSKQCWNTQTSRFISGFRKGITLINLNYTSYHLRRALLFVKKVTSKGGIIMVNSLYLNTHIDIINKFYNMGQIVAPGDWIGGYLSNYRNLKTKVISKRRSRAFVSALVNLNYNIDNRFISSEARNLRLPIISIFDTNSQCSIFDYPIPTNNKNSAIRTFYAFLFSSAVFWGVMRKLSSVKKRSISNYFPNGRVFKRAFNRSFTFNNSIRFSDDGAFTQKKSKIIYISLSSLKNNSYRFTLLKNFVRKVKGIASKRFVLFKNRFLHNDIVTNFDIMGLFISRALENIIYKVSNFKSINRFNFKNRNKSRIITRRYSFFKTFFPYKTIPFIFLKSFVKFDNSVFNNNKNNFFGTSFSYKKRGLLTLSRNLSLIFLTFFLRPSSNNVLPYPWRKEFLTRRKFSKIFSIFITIHRRNVLLKAFLSMRKNVKYMVKKAKIVRKYRFSKRNKRILSRKIGRSKLITYSIRKKSNVGRWNRTATVSFSGLYSTIELSRLFLLKLNYTICLDIDLNFPFLNVTEKFLLIRFF